MSTLTEKFEAPIRPSERKDVAHAARGSAQKPRDRKPGFFIVGAPKSGTTALDQYLAAHREVFVARKEMHHFGADLHFGSQFYRRDAPAYLAEFDAWGDESCAGEASVWYLFSQRAADEIKAFNPDARIIVMLREPAGMLYSLYHQFRSDGNENLPGFAEALQAEGDRQAGRRFSRSTYFRQGLAYRTVARYTQQVRRYFEVFGRERVQVIIYDDFLADTAGIYRKTLQFLGVSPNGGPAEFGVVNGSHTVRSTVLQGVLQDPLVRGSAIALRSCLPAAAFTWIQKAGMALSEINQRAQKYPPPAPELLMALKREFTPEVEQLSELLGRDLTHWNKAEPSMASMGSSAVATPGSNKTFTR